MIHHAHIPQQPIRRRTLLAGAAALPAAGALAACGADEQPTEAGTSGPPDEVTYVTNFGQFGRDAYACAGTRAPGSPPAPHGGCPPSSGGPESRAPARRSQSSR